jgi:hypothetical protein
MDLEGVAPAWLVRWLVDGALAALLLQTSVLTLTCYAWFCFWAIDALLSAIDKAIVMRMLTTAMAHGMSPGSRGVRARFWLSRFPGWLLKTWVGLPMFSVIQLILSKQPDAQQKLRSMASGYAWQSRVLDTLPAAHFWQLSSGSLVGRLVVVGLTGVLALYTYFYWSRGFDLVRRIRLVGDALMAAVKREGEPLPSNSQASARLSAAGWTADAIRSGLWFLALLNVRILCKNDVYERLTPRGYGLFRLTKLFGVTSGLSAVHPVVAGLYVASEMKDLTDLKETARLYGKHFANLPAAFRGSLSFSAT